MRRNKKKNIKGGIKTNKVYYVSIIIYLSNIQNMFVCMCATDALIRCINNFHPNISCIFARINSRNLQI